LRAGFSERIFTEVALARIADPVALAIRGIERRATAQAWPADGRCRDSGRFGIVGLGGGGSYEPFEQGVIVDFGAVCGTPSALTGTDPYSLMKVDPVSARKFVIS